MAGFDGKYSKPKVGDMPWPSNVAHCTKCGGTGDLNAYRSDTQEVDVCQSCGGTGHVMVMIVRERPEGT